MSLLVTRLPCNHFTAIWEVARHREWSHVQDCGTGKAAHAEEQGAGCCPSKWWGQLSPDWHYRDCALPQAALMWRIFISEECTDAVCVCVEELQWWFLGKRPALSGHLCTHVCIWVLSAERFSISLSLIFGCTVVSPLEEAGLLLWIAHSVGNENTARFNSHHSFMLGFGLCCIPLPCFFLHPDLVVAVETGKSQHWMYLMAFTKKSRQLLGEGKAKPIRFIIR